jgi:hypothetical protein
MGNTSSKTKAQFCKFNKVEFSTKIQIIADAYSVAHFYSDELLAHQVSLSLLKYQNYNELSENYFNSRRHEVIPELVALNPKINNFYDFYMALNELHLEYERRELDDNDRRNKLKSVFEIAFKIVQILTFELNSTCQEVDN